MRVVLAKKEREGGMLNKRYNLKKREEENETDSRTVRLRS